ncbi:MAG: PspA/IM30 family protein [Longimicrobiaceae bacterium]
METSASSTPKPHRTFWQRPEGKVGGGIMAGIGVALAYAFMKALPTLIQLAENTLYLVGLVGMLALIYCVVFVWDRPRTLLFYGLQMISRWITGNFVELDPVAILKSFVRQMEKRREVIRDRLGRIVGVRRMVEAKIAKSEKERQDALRLAKAAQGSGDDDGLNAHAEIAARRARDIEEYRSMKEQMTSIEKLLQRVLRRADYHIQTAQDEANQLADKHTLTREVASATAAAQGIFGDSDLAEVRDMAAERIRDDYEKRLGELQTLIDLTDFDHAVDLSQMAFRQEGLAQLAEAEKKVSAAELADPATTAGSRGASLLAAAEGTPPPPPDPGAGAAPSATAESRWRGKLRRQ